MSGSITFSMGVTLAVLAGLLYGLIKDKPADVLFVGAVVLLAAFGVIAPEEAFSGFANSGMLIVAALFVVAAGLRETGVMEYVGERFLGRVETEAQALFYMAVVLIPSAMVLNNTPKVALLVPVLIAWCRKRRISPSRLLMPLSFLSILGGTCSLIGTSTNLVVQGLLDQEPPAGRWASSRSARWACPVRLLGAVYLLTVGRKLLPDRKELIEQLEETRREYLVEMLVQPGCRLAGKTVARGRAAAPAGPVPDRDRPRRRGHRAGRPRRGDPGQRPPGLHRGGQHDRRPGEDPGPGAGGRRALRGLARHAAGPAALRGGDQPQLAPGRPGGARRRLPRALRRGDRGRAPQRRPADQQGRRHPAARRRHAPAPGRARTSAGPSATTPTSTWSATSRTRSPVRYDRAWLAAIIFLVMITAFVSGKVDIMLAALLAAGAMVAHPLHLGHRGAEVGRPAGADRHRRVVRRRQGAGAVGRRQAVRRAAGRGDAILGTAPRRWRPSTSAPWSSTS